jgi:hypothetical protein
MGVPQAVQNLTKLPSPVKLPNPADALSDVTSKLAVSLPALDALGKLPQAQFGLPKLPSPPPVGMPQLPGPPSFGMPSFGMPKLPPPPPIGLPKPPPAPSLPLLAAFG